MQRVPRRYLQRLPPGPFRTKDVTEGTGPVHRNSQSACPTPGRSNCAGPIGIPRGLATGHQLSKRRAVDEGHRTGPGWGVGEFASVFFVVPHKGLNREANQSWCTDVLRIPLKLGQHATFGGTNTQDVIAWNNLEHSAPN